MKEENGGVLQNLRETFEAAFEAMGNSDAIEELGAEISRFGGRIATRIGERQQGEQNRKIEELREKERRIHSNIDGVKVMINEAESSGIPTDGLVNHLELLEKNIKEMATARAELEKIIANAIVAGATSNLPVRRSDGRRPNKKKTRKSAVVGTPSTVNIERSPPASKPIVYLDIPGMKKPRPYRILIDNRGNTFIPEVYFFAKSLFHIVYRSENNVVPASIGIDFYNCWILIPNVGRFYVIDAIGRIWDNGLGFPESTNDSRSMRLYNPEIGADPGEKHFRHDDPAKTMPLGLQFIALPGGERKQGDVLLQIASGVDAAAENVNGINERSFARRVATTQLMLAMMSAMAVHLTSFRPTFSIEELQKRLDIVIELERQYQERCERADRGDGDSS